MKATHTPVFNVKRQKESISGTFGVYRDGELVEGGFFNRDAADECKRIWEEESEHARATGGTL